MQNLISTLTDWAKLDPTHRLELLRKAHDSAIRDLIENQGKDLTSASIGDSTFSFAPGAMSTASWCKVLASVIATLTTGSNPTPSHARITFR